MAETFLTECMQDSCRNSTKWLKYPINYGTRFLSWSCNIKPHWKQSGITKPRRMRSDKFSITSDTETDTESKLKGQFSLYIHCVKRVQIGCFFWSVFSRTEIYDISHAYSANFSIRQNLTEHRKQKALGVIQYSIKSLSW